jgi:hypothetical protein
MVIMIIMTIIATPISRGERHETTFFVSQP